MAKRIKAIHALRPRIQREPTVQLDELVDFISQRTHLHRGDIVQLLQELHEAILFYNQRGRGVKLAGLGTYLPNVRLNGALNIEHRQDPQLKRALNRHGFVGVMVNRQNIGKTANQLAALWDEQHPEDRVE